MIRDETATGQAVHSFPLEFASESITVRELIRERVYQEVSEYNFRSRREESVFRGLVQPTDAERALNGFKVPKGRDIDWEAQFKQAIDAFGAELVDRFGPLPEEVEHLLKIVAIKTLCRRANVEKIETGPKGAVLSFRDNSFANPEGLIGFIGKQGAAARVRPDMKVVLFYDWENPAQRLHGTTAVLRNLVRIAEQAKAA